VSEKWCIQPYAAVGKELQTIGHATEELMKDAWAVEDVWLIFVWHLMISKGRRKLFDALSASKEGKTTKTTSKGADGTTYTFEAEAVGCTHSRVSDWLRGIHRLSSALCFDCSMTW
jgi:hypothetical protein